MQIEASRYKVEVFKDKIMKRSLEQVSDSILGILETFLCFFLQLMNDCEVRYLNFPDVRLIGMGSATKK